LRGETEFSINELFKISKKYNISVDEIFGKQNDLVTFKYTKLTDDAENFERYLTRLVFHLKSMLSFEFKKLSYIAAEVPIFHSFFTDKLSAFKLFYWQRSVLNVKTYQNVKFSWDLIPKKLIELARHAHEEYMKVPCIEVWTDETILTGLRQINYYYESGLITKEITLNLFEDYRLMVEDLNVMANNARRHVSDKNETFWMYASEIVLGTNCIYLEMGELKHSYISFNTMNSLSTNNQQFCEETEHWVKNIEKKSTLISGVGEKFRYKFFQDMYENIDEYLKKVK
jgi:hypothetical protein